MLTLDIAISTNKPEGITKVAKMLPSVREGVRYVVSWQNNHDAPVPDSLLRRPDVEIHRLELSGLSNNRNNSIEFCKGDIILIADDDLVYFPDFQKIIIDSFIDNPEMDLAIFKVDYKNPKIYPDQSCRLIVPLPKNYYASSVEIAFLRDRINDLNFYPDMGLGNTGLACGEDELFLLSAIKRGYDCRYINKTIAAHPTSTTGDKVTDGILRGQGFIIAKIYPVSCLLRLGLKAYRLKKNLDIPFAKSLKHLIKGANIARKEWKSIPRKYRW